MYVNIQPSTVRAAETSKFFRALSQVGTDFTMMTLLIPRRSRKELKVIYMYLPTHMVEQVQLSAATCIYTVKRWRPDIEIVIYMYLPTYTHG